MSFDKSVFQVIYGMAHKSSFLDILGIFFAQYLGYFLIIGFLASLIFIKNWKLKFYEFSSVALAILLGRGLVTEVIRFFYYQPRPALVLSVEPLITSSLTSSFPSGHAAVFFAIAGAIFYFNRRKGIIFGIAALIMGLARIFTGVHWPLDILGGLAVGLISALIINYLFLKNFIPAQAPSSIQSSSIQ